MLRLVVGLGNPGPRYKGTRHNVGFRLVEAMAEAEGASWRDFRDLGRFCEARSLLFAEPLTYMNESGRFVAAFAAKRGIEPRDILVCADDLALPVGRLRIRLNGSSGGHHGLDSIIAQLGTDDFPRIRVGVGPRPASQEGADFVLGRFAPAETLALESCLEDARAAVELAAAQGLETAMNRFNGRKEAAG